MVLSLTEGKLKKLGIITQSVQVEQVVGVLAKAAHQQKLVNLESLTISTNATEGVQKIDYAHMEELMKNEGGMLEEIVRPEEPELYSEF